MVTMQSTIYNCSCIVVKQLLFASYIVRTRIALVCQNTVKLDFSIESRQSAIIRESNNELTEFAGTPFICSHHPVRINNACCVTGKYHFSQLVAISPQFVCNANSLNYDLVVGDLHIFGHIFALPCRNTTRIH